jgi:hypothetical protein
MILRNKTDLSDHLVLAVIADVWPGEPMLPRHSIDLTMVLGNVRAMAYHGATWPRWPRTYAGPVTILRICRKDADAVEAPNPLIGRWSTGRTSWTACGTRMEVLVYTLAHELRHVWQFCFPQFELNPMAEEYDADSYGSAMLIRYRRGELPLNEPVDPVGGAGGAALLT